MKRHLVWFESLDVSGSSETDSWTIRGSEQRFTVTEPSRVSEPVKLQRDPGVAPIAQASTQTRRLRSRRPR